MPDFRISPEIAWRKVGDEAVLLNVRTSVYYSLNNVGSRIWELISAGRSSEDVILEVVRDFDAEEAVVRKDFSELIKPLLEENILLEKDGVSS